jgi:hypothetical protein
VPFARSIDGHLAHHSLQALTPLRLRRKGVITVMEKARRTRAEPPLCAAVKLAALATLGAQIGSIWRDGTVV